jgi:hypothetical protein
LLSADHALRDLPNLVAMPHESGNMQSSRGQMASRFARDPLAFLDGGPLEWWLQQEDRPPGAKGNIAVLGSEAWLAASMQHSESRAGLAPESGNAKRICSTALSTLAQVRTALITHHFLVPGSCAPGIRARAWQSFEIPLVNLEVRIAGLEGAHLACIGQL